MNVAILVAASLAFVPQPGETPPPQLLTLQPGEARCDGGPQAVVRAEPPLPVALEYPNMVIGTGALRLRFRIDSTGRPLGIALAEPASAPGDIRDLVPAFATWQFAPGAERAGCEIVFQPVVTPFREADRQDLDRLLALGQASPRLREAAGAHLALPGSDCAEEPYIRLRAYPAFDEIAQPPGTMSYSRTAFDIDARGRPVRVRLLGSSGNAELDRQSLAAVRRSRYAPGARRGCTYQYWRRNARALAAPPAPPVDSFTSDRSTCPAQEERWEQLPVLTFPQEFLARGIEGWAILRYDLASWGAVGNIKVIAAEPAARFGAQAELILRGAKAKPSPAGATGCIQRILFRLPPGAAQER
jgi:TonB family protein